MIIEALLVRLQNRFIASLKKQVAYMKHETALVHVRHFLYMLQNRF